MHRANVETERPFIIEAKYPGTKVAVFRAAILSIDPRRVRYPTLLRCLSDSPRPEDRQKLIAEALAIKSHVPGMRFQLQRENTVFTNIFVETPPLGGLPGLLLSREEQPPRIVPIRERIMGYLNLITAQSPNTQ